MQLQLTDVFSAVITPFFLKVDFAAANCEGSISVTFIGGSSTSNSFIPLKNVTLSLPFTKIYNKGFMCSYLIVSFE